MFVFAYGALTLCGASFQRPRLTDKFVTLSLLIAESRRSRNSAISKVHSLTTPVPLFLRTQKRVWALPFSLAATWGIKYFSLFHRLLRCFTSAGTLPDLRRDSRGLLGRVSPFGDLRIAGYYAPPRSLSQLRRVLRRSLVSRHPPYALNPTIPKLTFHPLQFSKASDAGQGNKKAACAAVVCPENKANP